MTRKTEKSSTKGSEDFRTQKLLENNVEKRKIVRNKFRQIRNKMYRLLGKHIMNNYHVPGVRYYTYAQFKKYHTIGDKHHGTKK